MKRTLCLLLGLIPAGVLAAPSSSWLEVSYGELEREWALTPYDEGEGDETRLAGAYATSATGYVRMDLTRQAFGADVQPMVVGDELASGYFIVPATELDVDEWRGERERNISTLTAGLKSPLNSGVDLIGEIGVAQVQYEAPTVDIVLGVPGEVESVIFGQRESKQTGGVGRLGVVAEDGGVAWGATMEWYNKMPTGHLDETDSARWLHAYLGYRISPNWLISLRYSDTEEFKTKGLSLRWTL